MDCEEVCQQTLFLFFDNEMEEGLLVNFRAHVDLCPCCAQKLAYTRRLLTLVRQNCTRCAASEALRNRILTSFPHRRGRELEPL